MEQHARYRPIMRSRRVSSMQCGEGLSGRTRYSASGPMTHLKVWGAGRCWRQVMKCYKVCGDMAQPWATSVALLYRVQRLQATLEGAHARCRAGGEAAAVGDPFWRETISCTIYSNTVRTLLCFPSAKGLLRIYTAHYGFPFTLDTAGEVFRSTQLCSPPTGSCACGHSGHQDRSAS